MCVCVCVCVCEGDYGCIYVVYEREKELTMPGCTNRRVTLAFHGMNLTS